MAKLCCSHIDESSDKNCCRYHYIENQAKEITADRNLVAIDEIIQRAKVRLSNKAIPKNRFETVHQYRLDQDHFSSLGSDNDLSKFSNSTLD
jgi:hypothetical protein